MRVEIQWDAAHAVDAIDDGVKAGLRAWAAAIETGSNQRVPKLTGSLERSSHVDVDDREAAISYDDPAAEIQHERLNYRHPNGQAKFLEHALVEDGRDQVRQLANLLRSEIGD